MIQKKEVNFLQPSFKKGSDSFYIRLFAFSSAVILTTILVVANAAGVSTTIGTNISTNGTLSVGGASTLASALLSGSLNASSTFQVTGTTTLYSFVGIGTTSPGALFAVQGNVLISGDVNVANIAATGTLTVVNASTTGMLTVGNGAIVTGSSTVAGSLQVSGVLNASSTVSAGTTTLANLAVTNTSTSTIAGGLAVQTDKLVVDKETGNVGIGTATPSQTLAVSGNSLLGGLLTAYRAIFGPITATSTLDASGLSTLTGGFISTASSTFSSMLSVNGALNASTTLNVGGLANLSGFISSASSTIAGPLQLAGALQASSSVTVANTLAVSGLSNLSGLISSASSTVAGTLQVAGAIQASTTISTLTFSATEATSTYLAVSGNASTSQLVVSNTSILGGLTNFLNGLISSASSTFTSTLNVSGLSNLSGFISSASSTISSNLLVSGTLNASSTLAVAGNAVFFSNVGIGTTTPGALLAVHGNALFSGNISSVANITATGTLNVSGLSTLAGFISTASSTFSANLNISGPLSASSTLSVAGGAVLNGASSTVSGTLNVSGTLAASSTISANRIAIGTGTSTFAGGIETGTLGATGTSTLAGLSAGFGTFSGNLLGSGNLNITGTSTLAGLSASFGTFSSNLVTSGRLSATDLATLSGGFISSASSTISAQLHIAGNLQASSSVSLATTTITVNFASTSPGIPLTLYNTQSATNTQNRLAFQILAIATTSPNAVTEATTTAAITSILTQNYNPAKGILIFSTLNSGILSEAGRFTDAGLFQLSNGLLAVASSTFSANLNISGPLSASSTLSVAGGAVLNGASSTVSGTLNVSGTLAASSTISANRIAIGTGTSTFAGGIETGTLGATGTSTLAGLSAGFGTFSGNLLGSGNLNITGTSTLAGLSASFGTFSSNLVTSGRLSATDLATLSGGFISSASSTISSNLLVSGVLNASSTLAVAGNSVFYSNVGIGTSSPSQLFSVQGNSYFSGTSFFGGALTATSSVNLATAGGNLALGAVAGFSDVPIKLANPADLPAGAGLGASFSPDGTYLAIPHSTTPFVTIYKRSGDTFTKLANPADLPADIGRGASFSPDGTYLAIPHSTTPFVTIYKRSGDTFTKLANPADLPAGIGRGASFSMDGTYLAITHDASPFVTIYKRSGDTFTKLANPADLPAGDGRNPSFSPDGTYLVIAHATTPFVTIYKRSGDTFTKLANPADLPAGDGVGTSFSPDGTYLAIPHSTTPFVTVYKRSGDTFTKLANPADLPAGIGFGASFSPDGTYLAIAHVTTPFVTIYKRSGDTFTKLANPADLPAGDGVGTSFSPDGTYLAIPHSTTPFVTIYKGSGSAIHKFEFASATSTDQGLGFGKEIKLYRGAPSTLSLSPGNSLNIEFGELRMGGVSTSTTLIDSSFTGFFSKIGIGTTSPSQLLSVQGNALFSGNISSVANITATGTLNVTGVTTLTNASTTGMLTVGNGAIITGSSTVAGPLHISGVLRSSSTVAFGSNFVIDSSGNVGIGTNVPGQLLTMNGGDFQLNSASAIGTLQVVRSGTGAVDLRMMTQSDEGRIGTISNDPLTFYENSLERVRITSGNVGIGTTTPGSLFAVHGNGLFSGNLSLANLTATGSIFITSNINATGTISVTSTTGTSTIGSITIGSNGKIGIGTTTPNLANFEVATRTIAFNSGADGSLGVWATSSNTFSIKNGHSSVTANGYVYVLGGLTGVGSPSNAVQFAKLNSDGTTGSWATSTNTFSARRTHTSVIANGYVYVLGGEDVSGLITNTAQYAKLNSDGSVGTWTTSSNTFAARVNHSSVTANGYVYVLGGNTISFTTNTAQYAKLNSDGSVGTWATSTNSFAARVNHSSVTANGYVYVLGGSDGASSVTNTVQSAKLNSDGSTGSWATSTNSLVTIRQQHSSVIANGYVYVLGGTGGATVQYAKLTNDGSTGAWATSANTFAFRNTHSSVTANGYVYVLGGSDGANVKTNTVQYASTARILVSGNLDLIGLASTTLSDAGDSTFGSVGSSIFAGNIFSNGLLEVTGGTQLWGGLSVNGLFSLTASTSAPQNFPIFSIQNATGTSALFSVLYGGGFITSGSSTISNSLQLAGPLSASSTLSVAGLSSLTGGYVSVGSSTVAGPLHISGVLRSSSTVAFGSNFVINSSGNVGLGTTTPGALLAVQGDALIAGTTTVRALVATSSSLTVGGSNFVVDASGKVGIGTNAPTSFLHLAGSAPTLRFQNTSDTNYGGGLRWSNSNDVAKWAVGPQVNIATNDFEIADGASTRLIIKDSTGNVGIGTTTPAQLFSVHGGALIAGTTTIGHIVATGTIVVRGSATSTFTGNGLNLEAGCFAINGVCVGGGGGGSSNWTDAGAYLTPLTLTDGIIISASSTVAGNFKVSGNLLASSTITVTGTNGTSTIGSITIGPNGRIGIGTTTPNLANFEVATRTIAFNSGADGSLASWATNTNALPAVIGSHSSVIANGYVYVIGGTDGASQSTVYYAKLNSDGSTGAWSANTNVLPAIRSYHSSVIANGYVYVIGGTDGAVQSTVYYAKLNSNGSTGAWSTNANALPAVRYSHSSVIANGYVYVMGGHNGTAYQSTVYYAKLNSDGSTGAWSTNANALPAIRGSHSSVTANGYVYVMGGYDGATQSTVYYAKLNSNGSTDAWSTNANALPAVRYGHSSVIANGYVYVMGGHDGTATQSTVYYAKLNSDGSTGAWSTNANALPAVRYLHSSVIANGYVYVLGGNGGIYQSTVYYASTARILISGNLDLLGLASTTLSDLGAGSSIFAGDIFSAGGLEVTGNSMFWNGLGVNGVFSLTASTSVSQTIPIFSIQNATGTAPLLSVLYNGNVGIGTSSPQSKLSIEGTCIDTGAGCADYAELYPSSEPVEPGDVLTLDINNPGKVKKASSAGSPQEGSEQAQPPLIGAVSSNPAIIIEGSSLQLMTGTAYKNNPSKPAVALAGRIPVKVNLEGGEIKIGDPITISSVPGVGKKATTYGQIIGYALEPYNESLKANSSQLKADTIMVFVNNTYYQAPVDITTSQVVNSSLLAQVVDSVKAWLESMQVFISDGLVRLKKLIVQDELCIGQTCVDEAGLQALLLNAGISPMSPIDEDAASTTTPTSEPADTTSPIITLNGASTIDIDRGTSWVDPGATVIDLASGSNPENTNLSIYYNVDGVVTGNRGRDLPSIDTIVAGSHTIIYTSTDQAGNVGTATRTLSVIDPTPAE